MDEAEVKAKAGAEAELMVRDWGSASGVRGNGEKATAVGQDDSGVGWEMRRGLEREVEREVGWEVGSEVGRERRRLGGRGRKTKAKTKTKVQEQRAEDASGRFGDEAVMIFVVVVVVIMAGLVLLFTLVDRATEPPNASQRGTAQ